MNSVLENHKKYIFGLKEKGLLIRQLDMEEAFMIVMKLHPTKRKNSRKITVKFITCLMENEIVDQEDFLEYMTRPSLLKRTDVFLKHGLIRKEMKNRKVYIIKTERLDQFFKNYMDFLVV